MDPAWALVGAFLGLLAGKFALGLIFGFHAGLGVDSRKRRAAAAEAVAVAARDDQEP